MTVDEKVERAVERVRSIWGIVTVVGFLWTFFVLPWWAPILFCLFSVCSYFGSLWMTGIYLGLVIPSSEIEADRQKEITVEGETKDCFKKEQVEKVGLSLGDVVETSEPFGRYMGQPMFEWVDIMENTKPRSTVRYIYEQITPYDQVGNMLLPHLEGFACYNGITYKRSTT